MGCVSGQTPTSWAPPGTPRCASFCLNVMGNGLLAMGNRFVGYTIATKVIWYSQCDENSLMDCARQGTYRMVYSVVHDLGFHLWGPYW